MMHMYDVTTSMHDAKIHMLTSRESMKGVKVFMHDAKALMHNSREFRHGVKACMLGAKESCNIVAQGSTYMEHAWCHETHASLKGAYAWCMAGKVPRNVCEIMLNGANLMFFHSTVTCMLNRVDVWCMGYYTRTSQRSSKQRA